MTEDKNPQTQERGFLCVFGKPAQPRHKSEQ